MDHDPALGTWIAGQQELRAVQLPAEHELAPQVLHLHPAAAGVVGVGVLLASRVVELPLRAVGHHRRVGELTVIDLRAFDLERRILGLRRDVLHQQVRQALGREVADRCECQPVAVGVLETPVDEGLALRRQVVLGQLPCRDHDLAVAVADLVAVHVHVDKLVVEPNLLELLIDGVQRAPVPQADLGDQLAVVFDGLPGQVALGRVFTLLRLVEAEGLAREPDVVGDVGLLEGDLVGLDGKRLEGRRQQAGEQEPERDDAGPSGGGRDQHRRLQRPYQGCGLPLCPYLCLVSEPARRSAKPGRDAPPHRRDRRRKAEPDAGGGQGQVDRQTDVGISPTRSRRDARLGVQEPEAREQRVGSHQQAEPRADGGQRPRRPVAGRGIVCCLGVAQRRQHRHSSRDGGHHHGPLEQPDQRVQERQPEQVEPGIEAEQRLGDAGRGGVDEQQRLLPVAEPPEAAAETGDELGPGRQRRLKPPRRRIDQGDDGGRKQRAEHCGGALPADEGPEAAGVADGAEPECLAPEVQQREQQDRGDGEPDAAPEHRKLAIAAAKPSQTDTGGHEQEQEQDIHARLLDAVPGRSGRARSLPRPPRWRPSPAICAGPRIAAARVSVRCRIPRLQYRVVPADRRSTGPGRPAPRELLARVPGAWCISTRAIAHHNLARLRLRPTSHGSAMIRAAH